MVNLLCRLLQDETDITVVGTSGSAVTAIAETAALRPDLVVVDLSLREGSGYDVLRALHNRDGSRPIIIVLTNLPSGIHRNPATTAGADHFFDKSREIRLMCSLIRELSARRAAS